MASNYPETSTMPKHRNPVKGILKTSKSFEKHQTQGLNKSTKFDEMNVQLTHHPADKDYGHMKIDEPKTPYIHDDMELDVDQLDADLLADKLEKTLAHSKFVDEEPNEEEEAEDEDISSDDEPIVETEDELQKRLDFEQRRKKHYNEFEAVRLARQLMEQDELEGDGNLNDAVPSSS